MFKNFEVLENEELNKHTSFKIGGPARYFIFPKNTIELAKIIKICEQNNLKYFVLGNGSNILASDEGFDGVIINLKNFNQIKKHKYKDKYYITTGAGVTLFKLNHYFLENCLSNFEWSYGIPGSVGGAIKMNAGAFGHSFCEYISEITILKDGKIKKIKKPTFSYRTGPIKDEIILSTKLLLNNDNPVNINQNIQKYFEIKKSLQPYDLPSAGSIFKRNGNLCPSKIIDELGLKGLRFGDAMISTKHAGFIVNLKRAKCSDVLKLIEIIELYFNQQNLNFEKEIIYLH